MGVKIFSISKSTYLANKISKSYGKSLSRSNFNIFSDGEFCHGLGENVRGEKVFIIASLYSSYNEIENFLKLLPKEKHDEAKKILINLISSSDNVFELLQMIDDAKRASAKEIVAVIPYFGWARQDRKDKPRVPIGAKLMANLLQAAGVDRVVSMDLHADQIQGFFDVPFDHMYASSLFVPYLKNLNLSDLIMASPDTGGTKRAAAYAKFLNTELVISFKQRKKANEVDEMRIIGDVDGKNVVLIDDIIDTAGTIAKASNLMKEQGAKSVMAMCTHPVFSGKAYENINNSALDKVIVTDSIPIKKGLSDKIDVVSIAPLFADVLHRITEYKSISEYFEFTTIL